MRQLLSTLLVTLFLSASALAQSVIHPDPGAIQVDSFRVSVGITIDSTGGIFTTKIVKSESTHQVGTLVGTFMLSNGRKEYVISTSETRITGPGTMVNAIPTSRIFQILSHGTIETAIANGQQTIEIPQGSEATRVYAHASVTRTGSGAGTRFSACDLYEFSYRPYTVYSGGFAQLTGGGVNVPSGSGCEATHPAGAGSGIQIL